MEVKFHSAVIFCHDLQKQLEFYQKFLGQEVRQDLGACQVFKSGFTLWELGKELPISRELGYEYEPIGNRNLELCFETESFGDAVEKVLMSDLRILHNVEEEPWGQYTIRFYDPEGNLVEIGETLACMARRLSEAGLSLDEIAKKTGLDRDFVADLVKS